MKKLTEIPHTGQVYCARLSPDGFVLVSAGEFGVNVYCPHTGALLHKITDESSMSVSFDPRDASRFAVCLGSEVVVYQPQRPKSPSDAQVRVVVYISCNRMVVSDEKRAVLMSV